MPTIDKFHLEILRDEFKVLKDGYSARNSFEVENFRRSMESCGLDLNDDASYDLLEPGLTKDGFDDIAYLSVTHGLVNSFYSVMNSSGLQYKDVAARSRRGNLNHLMTQLDYHRPLLDSRTLPAHADPFHARAFNALMIDYKTGTLTSYHEQLAVPVAVEAHDELTHRFNHLAAAKASGHTKPYEIQHHLKGIQDVIDSLRKDMSVFSPTQMTDFLTQSKISQPQLTKSFQDAALMYAAHTAQHSQIEDPSLYYHRALRALDEAGIDIHAPATFTAMGADKKTFWDNYTKQVDWNNNGAGKAYGLPVTPYPSKP